MILSERSKPAFYQTETSRPSASQNGGFYYTCTILYRRFPFGIRVKASSPRVVISFLHPPSCCAIVLLSVGWAVPYSSLPHHP